MPCGHCGGGKNQKVEYELRLPGATPQRFTTVAAAQAALRKAQGRGTIRAVKVA